MAQGRPEAWSRIYRRLTPSAMWGRQPRLTDAQLFRLIRSFEVAGERRSTTRYLADVTFHFNPVAVRAASSSVGHLLYRSTFPSCAGHSRGRAMRRFDPMSTWAAAWSDESHRQGLVPMILPEADAENDEVLSRTDLAQADWAGASRRSRSATARASSSSRSRAPTAAPCARSKFRPPGVRRRPSPSRNRIFRRSPTP